MSQFRLYRISALAIPVLAACKTSAPGAASGSAVKDAVGSGDFEAICAAAGINTASPAERYSWFFGSSGGPLAYISASGIYRWEAKFQGNITETVDAIAHYGENLVLESGKPVDIRYSGGIANLKHTKQNFHLFLGYKIEDQDQWQELTWEQSPTTTYTTYKLDWTPPQTSTDFMKIWIEGRYTENGQEQRVYDSNNGLDFFVSVLGHPGRSACFTQDWREAVAGGDLRPGDTVRIVYPMNRIYQILNYTSYNGHPAWDARGFHQIYNASNQIVREGSFPVIAQGFRPSNGQPALSRAPFTPFLRLPAGVSGGRLVIWVRGFDRGSGAWDSDHSNNYTFPIQ